MEIFLQLFLKPGKVEGILRLRKYFATNLFFSKFNYLLAAKQKLFSLAAVKLKTF